MFDQGQKRRAKTAPDPRAEPAVKRAAVEGSDIASGSARRPVVDETQNLLDEFKGVIIDFFAGGKVIFLNFP